MATVEIMNSVYTLNQSMTKCVSVSIDATLQFDPFVTLIKQDKQGISKIKLTPLEFQSILDRESMLTSFFYKSGGQLRASSLMVTSNLRIRFDTSYGVKMIVFERIEDEEPFSTDDKRMNLTSIWLAEKTFFNLVNLLPCIKYMLDNYVSWCPEIQNVFQNVAKELRVKFPEEMKGMLHLKDFKALLSTFKCEEFQFESNTGLDSIRLLKEMFAICPQNLLYFALNCAE